LDVGCGISSILSDLIENEHTGQLIGIDYSKSAINFMKAKYDGKYSNLKFLEMDARLMQDISNESCDVVIDKATMDGNFCNPNGPEFVEAVAFQVGRVLVSGGIFVIISHMLPLDEEGWVQHVLPAMNKGHQSAQMEENKSNGKFEIIINTPTSTTPTSAESSVEQDQAESAFPHVCIIKKLRSYPTRTQRTKSADDHDDDELIISVKRKLHNLDP